ncbi:hypothetical protein [Pseudonocardia spinosispora]|uniref:hypothetical protein n=1 Tax=Pseudonocardia spinosispora TaxID=103441 RepID=UPI00040F78CD|nr:hypothetical protein [Pseudonocardia spinosispora]
MNLYGAVIRGDDPGAAWPRFIAPQSSVLWLGSTIEPRPHLLDDDLAVFAAHGMATVADLEAKLVSNMRGNVS